MRPTFAANFKSFLSKIHPQLPLTPLESQKLQKQIADSFRHHLQASPSAASESNDTHLRVILSSPFFGNAGSTTANPPETLARSGPSIGSTLQDIIEVELARSQAKIKSEIELFRSQVADGTASLDIANAFLLNVLRSAKSASRIREDPRPLFGAKRPATEVLHWLWSSGLEKDIGFASNASFTKRLIPLMLLEGQIERAWGWMSRLAESLGTGIATSTEIRASSSTRCTSFRNILKSLTWAHLNFQSDHNAAIQTFLRAEVLLEDESEPTTVKTLSQTANYLTMELLGRKNKIGVDVALFDKLIQASERHASKTSSLCHARLMLTHPSGPDPIPAFRYITEKSQSTQVEHDADRNMGHGQVTAKSREALIDLCLKTAHLLLEQKRAKEAEWVVAYVKDRFPREIGFVRPTVISKAEHSLSDSLAKGRWALERHDGMVLT